MSNNNKGKTVFILTNNSVGLYRFRKEVMLDLLAKGYKVFVASPNDGFIEELKALDVTYINTPISRRGANPFRDYALYKQYCALLKEIQPDIVLTYTIKPNIYGNLAARKLNIPVISTVTGLGDAFFCKGIVSWIVKFLCRCAFRKTLCIMFQNIEDEKILRNVGIIKNQRVLQVPGSGVNIDEHNVLKYPEESKINFLYIGRILRSKGIGQLISATRKLKLEYPDAFTVGLIGFNEGDISEEFDQAIQEGIISYAGFQNDIIPFIQDAHCVVLPSYKEGMSNVLLEAAACGRPLITTNVSGCREIVDDEVNGFLCEAQDIESLYNAMKRFIGLPQKQKIEMGQASRQKVVASFDRRLVVKAMVDEIANILGG